MRKSAQQHHAAALVLHERRQKAVAAYLFGLAAECAVKAIMLSCRIADAGNRESAYWAHFPQLRTQLHTVAHGRRNFSALRFATKSDFLTDWDITIRYTESAKVLELSNRYERWYENAKTAIDAMDAL